MLKHYFLTSLAALLLLAAPRLAQAQTTPTGGVGIGTTAPDASAALDVSSTSKGLLLPRLSRTQRDAIQSPATGLTIYNTTTGKLNVWNGTSWTEALAAPAPADTPAGVTFAYTGAVQTYTVPAGVMSVQVVASGADGGANPGVTYSSAGGRGARVQATLAVVPGQTLYVYVGGAGSYAYPASAPGGFNGGGASLANSGGSGGGASDVRTSAGQLGTRVLVAGGGGGKSSGFSEGGAGGTPNGGAAYSSFPNYSFNTGGTQTQAGTPGNAGLGVGSTGGTYGGGGGGGYYGGGGGNDAGGAGGSSWVTPTGSSGVSMSGSSLTFSDPLNNGSVSITPNPIYAAPALNGANIVNVPGTYDNLGNHRATQNLNLAGYQLVGNGGSTGLAIAASGTVGVGSLAGSGTRMVVADAAGNLGTQAVPSGDNLGNHTATTNIGLNGNWLSNAPGNANGLRVDNSGNVGIGTATPSQKLEVAGQVFSSSGGFRFPDNTVQTSAATSTNAVLNQTTLQSGANFNIGGNGTVGGNSTVSGNSYVAGNVGIGTTASLPSKLAVVGTGTGAQPLLLLRNPSGGSGNGVALDLQTYDPGTNPGTARLQATDDGAASAHLSFLTKTPGAAANPLVERLRIASGGNVGIGTSTPGQALEVAGQVYSNTGGFRFPDNTVQTTAGLTSGSAVLNQTTLQSGTNFNISGNGYVGGRVGIGTTTPNHPLTVQADATSNSALLGFNTSAGQDKYNFSLSGGGLNLSESGVAGGRLFVQDGGNVGIGTTTPSQRLEVNGNATVSGNVGIGGSSLTPYKLNVNGNTLLQGPLQVGTNAQGGSLAVVGSGGSGTTLDQQQAYLNGSVGAYSNWQSFTAGLTGNLTQIDLKVTSPMYPDPGAGMLYVFEGEGTGGTLLSSQAITYQPVLNSFQQYTLATPVPVVIGKKYTYLFNTQNVRVTYVNVSQTDVYSGGRADYSGNWDLLFRTYVTGSLATPLLTVQSSGNTGIGTASPGQKLEVAGQVFSSSGGFRFPDNTVQTTAVTAATGTQFVLNQTSQQANANFNISGSGTIGGNGYVGGRVGIGTTNTPAEKLEIKDGSLALTASSGTAQPASVGISNNSGALNLALAANNGEYSSLAQPGDAVLRSNGNRLILAGRDGGSVLVSTGPAGSEAERLRVAPGGNVGIGTSTPGQKLEVAGQIYSSTGGFRFPDNTVQTTAGLASGSALLNQTTQQANANFNISGTGTVGGLLTAGSATVSGNTTISGNGYVGGSVGIGTSSPGQKLEVSGDAAPTTAGTAGLLRLSRPGTSGSKWPNTFDLALGSYASGVNSQTRLDFNLNNGATGTPDMTALTLTGGGNVGIGTTAPGQKLEVAGQVFSSSGGFRFPDNTVQTTAGLASGSAVLNQTTQQANSNFNISGNGTVGGLLAASSATVSGNVGIGTTPAGGLHVDRPEVSSTTALGVLIGGGTSGNPSIELRGSGKSPYLDFVEASGLDYSTRLISQGGTLNLSYGGAVASKPTYLFNVAGGLQATAVSNTSDQRLKQNIRPLTSALASVLALRGVRYEWNALGVRRGGTAGAGQVGVLAQEVEKVFPELVSTGPDGYKAVNYAQLTPVLIEALKEQQQQIEALKAQVAAQAGDHASLLTLQAQMARLLGEQPTATLPAPARK